MKSYLVLAAAVACSAHAEKGFSDCATPKELRLVKGESLKVNCDYTIALNPEAHALLLDQRANLAKLPTTVDDHRKDNEALLAKQQQLISELKGMNEIQDRNYEALKAKYVEVDK